MIKSFTFLFLLVSKIYLRRIPQHILIQPLISFKPMLKTES